MASAEIVKLINEGIRPLANRFGGLYYASRVLQDRLDIPGGVGEVFEALTGKDPIDDGAASDGRPIATPENVKLFLEVLRTFLESMEANDKQNLRAILALSNQYQPG